MKIQESKFGTPKFSAMGAKEDFSNVNRDQMLAPWFIPELHSKPGTLLLYYAQQQNDTKQTDL